MSSGTLLSIPTYADLLRRTDGPAGSCWGLFGVDDEIGAVNFLTEERVLAATQVVRRGTTFNLDYPVNHFNPPPSKFRTPARHTIFEYRPHHNDDFVDGFYLQGTSQIDGFRHVAHHEHGYYNRAPKDRLVAGDPTIGVNRWAERGIVGRGVLLDVARYVAAKGRPLDHSASEKIGPDLLEEVVRSQGVELRPGDLLLVRTDWPSHFFKMASTDFEAARHEAGLEQSREMLAWLWDHQIPLVASDNFALEAYPDHPDSPFVERFGEEEIDGMIHPYLIAMLGMVIGELWKLEDLAEDCAGDGIYESLLVCKPMNLIGAVGSPANAVAIK